MFQFTTQTIINSKNLVDIEGNPLVDNSGNDVKRWVADENKIDILGVGTLQKKYITNVFHKKATNRVLEVAELNITGEVAKGDIVRLTITPSLRGKTDPEYVNSSLMFKHPQVVDIEVNESTKVAEELAKAIKGLRTEFGKSMFNVSDTGNTLTITAKDAHQRFAELKADKVEAPTGYSLSPKITNLGVGTIETPGKVGFGDYFWMTRRVVIPTSQNRSFFGIKQDERPIEGATYDQFTIHYASPTGIKDVNRGNYISEVTHVFWVKSDLVGLFETALLEVLPDGIIELPDELNSNGTAKDGVVKKKNSI